MILSYGATVRSEGGGSGSGEWSRALDVSAMVSTVTAETLTEVKGMEERALLLPAQRA